VIQKKKREEEEKSRETKQIFFKITHTTNHTTIFSFFSSFYLFVLRVIIIIIIIIIMRATLIIGAKSAGGTTTTAARGGGGGGKRGGKRGASRTPFVLALREEKTTTTTTTTILRNECFERGRRRRKATNDDAFDHRFRTRALFEKTPAVDGLGGAEEEEETKKTKKEEENAPTKREEEEEEEKEKKRRARTGNGTSSSSSSSSSGKSLGTSNGISFSSISSPASAFVSSVLSSTAAAAAKKKETKKTKTDWETSSSSSSSSFSRRRREDEDEIGPLLIGWGDAVEVTIDDGDDEVGEEEDENVQDYENEARGAAEGDANGEKDGVVTVAKDGSSSSSSSGEKILSSSSLSSSSVLSTQQQQQQQTTTTTTGKTKATSSSARAGSKSKKSSSRKDGSSSSLKREEIKSLSAYPYQNVAEQSVEARREQLLNAIDWGVVENGEEALRIFDEQVAKSQSQEKSSIEMFFDETPNARIFLKFVVFPAVFSQTMNYSFIEPYFDAKFDSMGENVAAEMLPMHLRQDILQNVERNEQMREYEIQMGRAPQLTDKQKIQARIKDAKAIEEKTIKERKKELSNRWTDVAFISAFFMSFFGRRSAAKDWIDQTKNWFFDLGPANQAFILLLSSDVLVGYHSADGWNTVLESLGEKYGITDNHAAISIFTALVPVGMDVLFKFWVFKYLRKLAPSTQIILDDIDRH
jgi:lipoprotein signal peptidase